MNRLTHLTTDRPFLAKSLDAAPKSKPPSQFVGMLWKNANLFRRISLAATAKGLPTRALRAAAIAHAFEDMARSETDAGGRHDG